MLLKKFDVIFIIAFFLSFQIFCNENDTIYTLNSKSNTLYLGIDNYIHVPEVYLNDSAYDIRINNGKIFKDSSLINVIPRRLPDAFLNIYKYADQDTILIKSIRYFIKYVPKPCILINNQCLNDISIIDRNEFINNPVLGIYISDDIIGSQDWYKIKRFSFGYVFGSVYKSFESSTNLLTDEMIEALHHLKPGQEVHIKISIVSQGFLVSYLPVYTIKIY